MAKFASPLKDAPAGRTAADIYAPTVAFGPTGDTDGAAPPGELNDWMGWRVIDAAQAHCCAVWTGLVWIVADETPAEPVENKRVTLGLVRAEADNIVLASIAALSGIIPRYAFYRGVRFSTLGNWLRAIPTKREAADHAAEVDKVLELRGAETTRHRLFVRAGEVIGDITLAPERFAFALTTQPSFTSPIYPHAFYSAAAAAGLLMNLSPSHERSCWSVAQPRIIVQVRDEWNTTLPAGSPVIVDLARVAGGAEPARFNPASGWAAFGGAWLAEGPLTLRVRVTTDGVPRPLLLSAAGDAVAAAEVVERTLTAPAELIVQAIDPDAWFPEQGGIAVRNGAPVPVDLPVPHRPARWTNGNTVEPLIDGREYYRALNRDLWTLTNGHHFLCHGGWWFDHDLALDQTTSPRTGATDRVGSTQVNAHWARLDTANVPMFGLFWSVRSGPNAELAAAIGAPWPVIAAVNPNLFVRILLTIAFPDLSLVAGVVDLPGTEAAVAALNAFGHGQAIWDGRLRPGASHHQKFCVLRGPNGLVAYLGGIDINHNRVNSKSHDDYIAPTNLRKSRSYHDVQCRVTGPAARDVLRTFISRWNDHPPGNNPAWNKKLSNITCAGLAMGAGGAAALTLEDADTPATGTQLAQIARTYGNCKGMSGVAILSNGAFADANGYSFAPDGDFTVESALLRAIGRAKRFIYIEDQYLGNLKVAVAVAERIRAARAAPNPKPFFVYIVAPEHSQVTALPREWAVLAVLTGTWAYTISRWHDILIAVDPEQAYWGIYHLSLPPYSFDGQPLLPPDRRIYVHTKSTIVDDLWATIGSANIGVRSMTTDSELNINFIDGVLDWHGTRDAVRTYRARLWAEHLGIGFEDAYDMDGDSAGAIGLWRSISSGNPVPMVRDPRQSGGRNRLYRWDGVNYVQRDAPLGIVFDAAVAAGIADFPIPLFLMDPYGKQPWPGAAAAVNTMRPPRVGSALFSFDGQDGAAYAPWDSHPGETQP